MPFIQKQVKNNQRRSFQINIGLEEGYGTNKRHTAQDVLDLIGQWMIQRIEAGLPVITGGMLLSGLMVYAWDSETTGVKVNQEDAVLFVGEVNPLYSGDLEDVQVREILFDLAGNLGDQLNQTRMYVMYLDEIFILQNDKAVHPTEIE